MRFYYIGVPVLNAFLVTVLSLDLPNGYFYTLFPRNGEFTRCFAKTVSEVAFPREGSSEVAFPREGSSEVAFPREGRLSAGRVVLSARDASGRVA